MKKSFIFFVTLIICASIITGCTAPITSTSPATVPASTAGLDCKTEVEPSPQGNALSDIWGSSSSDVFAVGVSGTIRHYNGEKWSDMISGTTDNLSSVWGSSSSDVFTVGEGGTILHYDGKSWSAMASGTTNWLYAVWGTSSSDVFVKGPQSNLH